MLYCVQLNYDIHSTQSYPIQFLIPRYCDGSPLPVDAVDLH
uniref:Uncharacterized protein n=1 Tax=Arundo donax TaxID=35708 RepID=A0A0A9H507_ARUDO